MVKKPRNVVLLEECVCMSADLVDAQGDEYLPLFKASVDRLQAAYRERDYNTEMREKALALSHWRNSLKGSKQSLKAILGEDREVAHHHNPPYLASDPSTLSSFHPQLPRSSSGL